MQLIPTILCGGAGSRLWPVSREMHPKPFIRIVNDGQSLLQKAYLRACGLHAVKEVITVTNEALFFKTEDEYNSLNIQAIANTYILEPCSRNTAAAIAASVVHVLNSHQDAIMLILTADHLIQNIEAFKQATQQAIKLAELGNLVTFGIKPKRADTAFGYIHVASLDNKYGECGYIVSEFVEKPDAKTAEKYFKSGEYLWNSGMFCFKAEEVYNSMQKYCPDIIDMVNRTYAASLKEQKNKKLIIKLDGDAFEAVPEDSFDYAVMEPASIDEDALSKVMVVPCDMAWSDIGSWQTLGELIEPDENNNRIHGNALMHATTNCYIHSPNRLVGTVGVKDLMVIDTPDAILIAAKNCAQEVKHLYTDLKNKNHEAYKVHRTVHRPWGTYTILEEAERFKIKRIEVNPGASLSLQMHHHRSEHWIVVSGIAEVINGDKKYLLNTNESTYIPAGNQHRLENPGLVKLVMIEVQSGEYLGEDDIVRFEDQYGRVALV
ncbi:MAG: mannose-1-phosphate guanylyltransferase/mannose-6-phosphate isomerase [Legionellales bacterium RIFCSPHIGHO2_12_FULL_37_14]|nr:MAG: mannose-1-phosphate guanylyltransferase/mannose-6-phosphate isomerase [Legionellales bacterium RIFCSPHIGHO2_12_FULL_37_14]